MVDATAARGVPCDFRFVRTARSSGSPPGSDRRSSWFHENLPPAPVQDGEFIDDRLFVSTARDHTAIVWDVTTARPLTSFPGVDGMVVSGDRRSVAFISKTGVRIWSPRAPTPDLSALRLLLLDKDARRAAE